MENILNTINAILQHKRIHARDRLILVHLLVNGETCRGDLIEMSLANRTHVTMQVRRLVDAGYILRRHQTYRGFRGKKGGNRRSLLRINPHNPLFKEMTSCLLKRQLQPGSTFMGDLQSSD